MQWSSVAFMARSKQGKGGWGKSFLTAHKYIATLITHTHTLSALQLRKRISIQLEGLFGKAQTN